MITVNTERLYTDTIRSVAREILNNQHTPN